MTKQQRSWNCEDCKGLNDEYMVRNEVWKKIIKNASEANRLLLCLDCLQARLGRRLTPEDFNFAIPVNRPILFGIRLAQRP